MTYLVRLKREAFQDVQRLPLEAQLRLLFAMGIIARTPTRPTSRLAIKPMRGHPGFWRLAVGPWRAVHLFDGETVRFFIFGHRATIYQQFEYRK
jgi:mRNA-degrading endonuclease RelE of RelBE toxin-antitoxin system